MQMKWLSFFNVAVWVIVIKHSVRSDINTNVSLTINKTGSGWKEGVTNDGETALVSLTATLNFLRKLAGCQPAC